MNAFTVSSSTWVATFSAVCFIACLYTPKIAQADVLVTHQSKNSHADVRATDQLLVSEKVSNATRGSISIQPTATAIAVDGDAEGSDATVMQVQKPRDSDLSDLPFLQAAHPSLVSENASFFTPGAIDGRVEAIAIEGDTVFVGGTFTQIQMALDGEIFNQPYLFAYSKSTGAILEDFDPILNKPVRALQTTGDGAGIFAGGDFTTLNGETNRKGLVKLDKYGDRVQGFSARPNKRVYTMDRSGNTLYIGGNFDRIGQVPVEYLAAIDAQSGALLPTVNMDFDGVISTTRTRGSASVDVLKVTSDNQLMVVVGNFLSINGVSRSRLALLELGDQTSVSNWNTDVFDIQCPARKFPQYINGIDIAPDDSYFVTGTTGGPLTGYPACDTILRFELNDLTDTDAKPTWINYTGGDSVYEVATSEHAIYTGGHFRWLNNAFGRDWAGPGAVERRGLAVLDPLNGLPLLNWRADRNPRGVGVFSLETEPEGLYIGDDTDFLNGFEHLKFKFLPITSNTIKRPDAAALPSSIFNINGNALDAIAFDGTTLSAPMTLSGTGWENTRGAMHLGGQLFHADDNGDMWVSELREDNTLGERTQVDLLGLTSAQWDLAQLGGMFFDHERGRVYYSLENDPRLLWRAFTPDGPIFGDSEFVAKAQGALDWSKIRGMDVIGDRLYLGHVNGNLYRMHIDGSSPIEGAAEAVSGPDIDGKNWNFPLLAFSAGGTLLLSMNDAQFEFESAGSSTFKSFKTFEFPVTAGQPVDIRLIWDDPNAQLNVFLRDANGQLVDSNNDQSDSAQKWLSAPAGEGGIYRVAVKIQQGSTAYSLSVNPAEEPPAPLSDIVFSASGSETTGRWQIFKFDVEAGDLVDVQVVWNDPSAELRLFLRDETNSAVDSDTDGSGSVGNVTAVADTSGRWSVGVRVQSGAVDYDVLVNTE